MVADGARPDLSSQPASAATATPLPGGTACLTPNTRGWL